MNLTQYGDYFYLYMLFIICIPAVILKLLRLNIKYYGLTISIIFDYMVIGGKIGIGLFILFLIGETAVIYTYLFIRSIFAFFNYSINNS